MSLRGVGSTHQSTPHTTIYTSQKTAGTLIPSHFNSITSAVKPLFIFLFVKTGKIATSKTTKYMSTNNNNIKRLHLQNQLDEIRHHILEHSTKLDQQRPIVRSLELEVLAMTADQELSDSFMPTNTVMLDEVQGILAHCQRYREKLETLVVQLTQREPVRYPGKRNPIPHTSEPYGIHNQVNQLLKDVKNEDQRQHDLYVSMIATCRKMDDINERIVMLETRVRYLSTIWCTPFQTLQEKKDMFDTALQPQQDKRCKHVQTIAEVDCEFSTKKPLKDAIPRRLKNLEKSTDKQKIQRHCKVYGIVFITSRSSGRITRNLVNNRK